MPAEGLWPKHCGALRCGEGGEQQENVQKIVSSRISMAGEAQTSWKNAQAQKDFSVALRRRSEGFSLRE
jgi:hypothetical protein